jgi:dual specificity phosphatase 12
MGKSRSAAVCIAYLLHRQPKALTPQTALDLIRKGRPMCEPNEGFMRQLSLYQQMGCPDDVTTHPLYQRWLSHREIEDSVACGRAPEMDVVRFEDELSPETAPDGQSTEVKCRKCRLVACAICSSLLLNNQNVLITTDRRVLATAPFIIEHESEGRKSKNATGPCAHVFLHPLTWMRPSLFPGSAPSSADWGLSEVNSHEVNSEDAPLSGRLTCPNPKCESNVGKFAWQGMRCSCGKWVVPAMGVARAKVDVVEKPARNDAGSVNARMDSMGIRLPPHMRSATGSL